MWTKPLCDDDYEWTRKEFLPDIPFLSWLHFKMFYSVKSVYFLQAIELAKALKGDRQTITVDTVRQSNWHNTDDFKSIDAAHILNTILSRDLPPERFGAIINLILATNLRASTEEEIEDSLVWNYRFSYEKIQFHNWIKILFTTLYFSEIFVRFRFICWNRKHSAVAWVSIKIGHFSVRLMIVSIAFSVSWKRSHWWRFK